jgi:phosphatidyl-myo-inositol dimannoside synthase
MRILLVSNYFPEHVGGIETVAANLARGYRARGHSVRWLAADTVGRPHREHSDDLPLQAWNVTEERLGFPYPIPGPRGVARLIAEAGSADVIHVHDCLYVANVVASLAGSVRGKPILITQHIGLVPYRRALLRGMQRVAYATLGRLILGQAPRVIFVSQSVADWFAPRLHGHGSPEVIENGVDSAIFKPLDAEGRRACRKQLGLPETTPVLLFSGRFVEKKGLHLLRDVVASQPAWTWVFIGTPGDIHPGPWRLANAKILPAMPQAELARYYVAADLLVLPSAGEGFPVAVQEAMACGTPALVSEEVRENLRDATAFATARNGHAIRIAIAQALDTIAAEPGLRERVAGYARERWDWNAVVDKYESALRKLADSGRPSRQVAA